MPVNSENTVNAGKIIVGIDYGTTYSGVSYVTSDKSDIDDIKIVMNWPGGGGSLLKTPTRIAYARENSQIKSNKWGFDVNPKLISYSWTKLLLDKNAAVGDHDDPALSNIEGPGMLRLPEFRDAMGVCEDFLREIYLHVSSNLQRQLTDSIFRSTPMECWITLPAIWSDEAKDATLAAARRAGFGSKTRDEVYTIAEPEAAAIATLKRYSMPGNLNPIKPLENILICDCGGGTVDITTYTVTQVSPRLDFDELCIGVGGKCGSTYIDRNLHSLLSKRFGAAFDKLPFAQKGPGSRLMSSFEKYKQDFGLRDDRDDIREIGPITLDVADSDFYDDEERVVRLTYEDMEGLFDPVIEEITNLVGKQVAVAKESKNAEIDRIILVGGFAESPYLHNALDEWCWRNGGIMLICPPRPQSAVVCGAALRGLEGIAPRVKYARRHYGISLNFPFREGIDPEEKAFFDEWDDTKRCMHRMQWLISKGDEVVQGTSRTVACNQSYSPGVSRVHRLNLYSCSLADAPEYCTHPRVDQNGVIISKFDANFNYGTAAKSRYNPKRGKTIHLCDFNIEVVFGDKGNNLRFKFIVNGNVISTADIEFNQQ
ncbi:Hsp70 family protein-like protein [Xylogone sp. PMI_703]|nr:Hsp70 family protein-like protein [Xylogone sp. PMI_703]